MCECLKNYAFKKGCRSISRLITYYGPEFNGKALDAGAFEHGVQIEFTRPGKPTDNGHIESFNGKIPG
ncbi:integrase core domain-containing protein [uncultured Desulfovibrio sp.]|uniref:integrase core domain-containing protein n=1 Tax=uncultured Desulfovibrio sp. TaxID=167968 RepID=UPI00341A39F4